MPSLVELSSSHPAKALRRSPLRRWRLPAPHSKLLSFVAHPSWGEVLIRAPRPIDAGRLPRRNPVRGIPCHAPWRWLHRLWQAVPARFRRSSSCLECSKSALPPTRPAARARRRLAGRWLRGCFPWRRWRSATTVRSAPRTRARIPVPSTCHGPGVWPLCGLFSSSRMLGSSRCHISEQTWGRVSHTARPDLSY